MCEGEGFRVGRFHSFIHMHVGYIVERNHLKELCRGQTTINLENVFIAGYFPLQSEHCLVWICLDVLFCTASIMHLCTISIDRYLSLRYPMRFGRNKTRKRVILKIFFVWLLSIAMSLPLSLMYSKVNFIRHKLTCYKTENLN